MAQGGGMAPIASEVLPRIAALYCIEDDIRGRSAEERRTMSQERSRPLTHPTGYRLEGARGFAAMGGCVGPWCCTGTRS